MSRPIPPRRASGAFVEVHERCFEVAEAAFGNFIETDRRDALCGALIKLSHAIVAEVDRRVRDGVTRRIG